MQVFKRFDTLAIINLVQNILSFIIVLLAFINKGTLVDVVMAYLVAKVFNGISLLVFSMLYAHRELSSGWWRVSWDESISTKNFWQFAFSSNLSATVKLIAQDSEELWITYFLSPLAAGYYNTAMRVIAMVLLPINPFIEPTFLEITTQAAKKEWQKLKELLRKTSLIAGVWTVGMAVVLVSLGWWLIPFAYGEEFAPSTPAALILLVGFGLANSLYWNRPLLLALKRPLYPLVTSAVAMLVKIGLAVWLVPQYGYLAQAGLLSIYLVVTVGLNAWQGLKTVQQRSALEAAT
ncbi:MAG TPA: hypothetical protein DCY42_05705 [Chloroflexi bacterium]|nr:hypothetical protein [Chloroflexota bacterium]